MPNNAKITPMVEQNKTTNKIDTGFIGILVFADKNLAGCFSMYAIIKANKKGLMIFTPYLKKT